MEVRPPVSELWSRFSPGVGLTEVCRGILSRSNFQKFTGFWFSNDLIGPFSTGKVQLSPKFDWGLSHGFWEVRLSLLTMRFDNRNRKENLSLDQVKSVRRCWKARLWVRSNSNSLKSRTKVPTFIADLVIGDFWPSSDIGAWPEMIREKCRLNLEVF